MRIHGNARSCPRSRSLLCGRVLEEGWSLGRAAEAAGLSERRAREWLRRFLAEGDAGLLDRSSAPVRVWNRTPPDRVAAIAALRRLRMTAWEIAEIVSMPASTVSAVLARIGLGKRPRLEPAGPVNRYQRRWPGELIHIDVKKLARFGAPGHRVTGSRRGQDTGAGWEYVHIAIDDATRLAYVEVLSDEKAQTAAGFLRRTIGHYQALGITVERVMTDNGPCYRAFLHALTCKTLAIKHVRTRPYRPQTNGKAERFIQTLVDGWAYGAIYQSSQQRRHALPAWIDFYNQRKPHASLNRQPPLKRLEALMEQRA
jgi:transposase InsO family protein